MFLRYGRSSTVFFLKNVVRFRALVVFLLMFAVAVRHVFFRETSLHRAIFPSWNRHFRAHLYHINVLLVRHRKCRPANLPLFMQLQLVVHEPNIQSSLMGVQSGILHGQNPRDFVAFVVMRMPPPRRRDKYSTWNPIASNRIDYISFIVYFFPHQRVHARFRCDG